MPAANSNDARLQTFPNANTVSAESPAAAAINTIAHLRWEKTVPDSTRGMTLTSRRHLTMSNKYANYLMNILINEHLRRTKYSGVLKRLTHDVSVTASQHALDYNSPPTSCVNL